MEDAFEEGDVPGAAMRSLHVVNEHRRKRVDGRVDVAKIPLVCRQLAVRVYVEFVQQHFELLLGEIGIDHT